MTLLLTALVGPAFPCAGIFHGEGALAESDAQQVVFEQVDAETFDATFRVRYDGDAADFGWVIPIVGEVAGVEDGDDELFAELEEATAAAISWHYDESGSEDGGGRGCRREKSNDGLPGGRGDTGGLDFGNDVEVIAEGFTGAYSWSVLESDSAEALQLWLDENGWSVGASGPAIDAYVNEGAQFVAIALAAADALTPDGGRTLPPVRIRYDGEARYPAQMGYYGDVEELRTTIYMIGARNAALASGWTAEALGTLYGGIDDDPSALYDEALRELGRAVSFGLIDASGWGDQRVTRFDALASRSVYAVDPVFTFDGGDEDLQTRIWLEEGYSAAALGWLLPLLGIGVYRRRRC